VPSSKNTKARFELPKDVGELKNEYNILVGEHH
jgi:hypothetical protein